MSLYTKAYNTSSHAALTYCDMLAEIKRRLAHAGIARDLGLWRQMPSAATSSPGRHRPSPPSTPPIAFDPRQQSMCPCRATQQISGEEATTATSSNRAAAHNPTLPARLPDLAALPKGTALPVHLHTRFFSVLQALPFAAAAPVALPAQPSFPPAEQHSLQPWFSATFQRRWPPCSPETSSSRR
jgi:hypothetical protein